MNLLKAIFGKPSKDHQNYNVSSEATKNFLELDNQIELNLREIDLYQSLYERNQNKFSFLVIIYSFICFYIIELFTYAINSDFSSLNLIYKLGLLLFICLLYQSAKFSHKLIQPVEVAYLNQPKYFYETLKSEYIEALRTEDEETLNMYIKTTYLKQTEEVLANNINVFQSKSHHFYLTFRSLSKTLICYILLSSFVLVQKDKSQQYILIENFKEIIDYTNKTMSENKKPKVDPSKVIITKPVMVKESVNLNAEKRGTVVKKTSVKPKKEE